MTGGERSSAPQYHSSRPWEKNRRPNTNSGDNWEKDKDKGMNRCVGMCMCISGVLSCSILEVFLIADQNIHYLELYHPSGGLT